MLHLIFSLPHATAFPTILRTSFPPGAPACPTYILLTASSLINTPLLIPGLLNPDSIPPLSARLRFARAYLVSGGDVGGTPRGGTRPTFDPGDADHFAAAASPVLRGTPTGQRN